MNKITNSRWQQMLLPFHLFRLPQYRLLWLISTFVNAGQWSFLMASGWEAYALTHSSLWSGAIVFAVFVPSLFGSPFVGVLVDKFDRKQILTFSLLLATIFNLILSMLSLYGYTSVLSLFAVALLYGISLSILGVTVNTLVPRSVPAKKLFNAVYLQSLAQMGAEFIGPALASPFMESNNTSAVYLFTAIVYLISLLFSLFLISKQYVINQSNSSVGFLSQIKNGIHYINQNKKLRTMIALTSLHCILTMSYIGLLPLFVNQEVHAEANFYGTLLTYTGLGSIMGILLLTIWNPVHSKNKIVLWSALISGVSLILLSISTIRPAMELSVFLAGISQGIFMTLAVAFIQELTEEKFRGRVNSVYLLTTTGFMSIFNLLYSTLGTYISVRIIFGGMGLLFLLASIAFWVRVPSFYRTNIQTPVPKFKKVS